MLPRFRRLTKTADIRRAYQSGRKATVDLLRLYAVPQQLATSRATVIVSKRVSLLAVERNRLRRQLRALLVKPLLDLPSSYDIVMVVQPKAKGANYQALGTAFKVAWQRLKLTA